MGSEAFLVASTANVIIAQRLVRKLCNECKLPYTLSEKEIKTLSATFDMDAMLAVLKKAPLPKDMVTDKSTWKNITLYHAKGCEQCNNEGYKGRSGIYEVLEVTEEIGKLITSNASADDIERKARQDGMMTMSEDGFCKAVQGIISVEEVLRVTKE
jgi:type II secretory ATPase GspE/PulE/Tfp pilus assembly ATPase PilB-like protein